MPPDQKIIFKKIFMRQLFTPILFLCISELQAFTTDDIKKEYATVFSIKVKNYKNESYVTTEVNKLPDNHFLADFVNNNDLYIDYILTNYSSIDKKKLNSLTSDTLELNNFFIKSLRTDTLFNKYFLEAIHCYLSSVGKGITDHQVQDKIKLSSDSLVKIATRFFYATRIKDNGEVQWNVCVGKNGYHYNTKDNMLPLIEAFCFNAIMKDLTTDEYKVISDFQKNIKALESQKTDKNGDEKLDYYRQTMYQMMGQNEKLKKLLRDKYDFKKRILNFELT